MNRSLALAGFGALTLAACGQAQEAAVDSTSVAAPASAPASTSTATPAQAIPAEVRAVVLASRPTMTIAGATLKERDGRRYYDVEGELPGGQEIELDLLETPQGWKVVEIQRDIPWTEAPAAVKAATEGARKDFTPVRVIESTQAEGGEVIYELFIDGQPATPALEVMVKGGKAEVLKEVWPH